MRRTLSSTPWNYGRDIARRDRDAYAVEEYARHDDEKQEYDRDDQIARGRRDLGEKTYECGKHQSDDRDLDRPQVALFSVLFDGFFALRNVGNGVAAVRCHCRGGCRFGISATTVCVVGD